MILKTLNTILDGFYIGIVPILVLIGVRDPIAILVSIGYLLLILHWIMRKGMEKD